MSLINERSLAAQVLDIVRTVVGPGPEQLHAPRFAGNEWKYVKECIDSSFVSSVGEFVDRFERTLVDFTGAKYAVAVVNGTAALQVALRLSGVQPGDEVLLPALTFVASTVAVIYAGGTPHFVDSEERTLGLDPVALRTYLKETTEIRGGRCINKKTGRVIHAVVPMHTFGHAVDMHGVMAVARDFNLVVVEDAAESLGSSIGGRHTGTFGVMGTFSFNGNKTVTTGGGGAIITNDPALAKRAKHLTTTAKVPHRWDFVHDDVGYNYRMPNINAALGCAQLESLPESLAAKRRLYRMYKEAFASFTAGRIVAEPTGTLSNYWLQTLLLDEAHACERDAILTATNDAQYMTRPVWTLMHRLAPYRECPRMELPVAESLERRIVNIPSSAHLGMVRK